MKFHLEQKVWFSLDSSKGGIVTGILQRPTGFSYMVTWSHDMAERSHYECELTLEQTFAGG